MRQKHLKKTYKALYMLQAIVSGHESRIIIGHSKITHIDDDVIEAAGKSYEREAIGKPIVIQNDMRGVVLKIPFFCDNPGGAPVRQAIEYIKENASLNIASPHLFDKCKVQIVNAFGNDDIVGFKLLAFAISKIQAVSIDAAKITIAEECMCNEVGISCDNISKYFERKQQDVSIYDWILQFSMDGRKTEAYQIVTDSKCCKDGNVEICFNINILMPLRTLYLDKTKGFFEP